MEGSVMSLSTWEQDALDSIKDRLASSDPTLVARLTIFARLASNEAMPAREEIRATPRRDVRHSHPEAGHSRRVYQRQRLGLAQAALLLWLVTTVALIVVVLVHNRASSQVTCTGPWATICAHAASASSAPGIP
jgi:Protein of unknown function (DUF3040)